MPSSRRRIELIIHDTMNLRREQGNPSKLGVILRCRRSGAPHIPRIIRQGGKS